MQETLKNIIGQKVIRLFLIIWPPYGEDNTSQIDISIGLVMDKAPNKMLKISTDTDDLSKPFVEYSELPKSILPWSEYETSVKKWMNCDETRVLDNEYYEVSKVPLFENIVDNVIKDIQLLIVNDDHCFGIKLVFEDDYIYSSPIIDGNTIETKSYNKNDNLRHFETLGKITYKSVLS